METDSFTQIFTNLITRISKSSILWSTPVSVPGQMDGNLSYLKNVSLI